VVVLIFETEAHARAALPQLPGFSVGDKSPNALVTTAKGKGTTRLLRLLNRYRVGDKTHAIDGLPFSIDCGPRFDVAIPVEHLPIAAG
jgi:hypothetical protein